MFENLSSLILSFIICTPLGLQEGALNQTPSDIELQRLVSRCDDTTIRELAIYLGMSFQECEDVRCDYDQIMMVRLKIMVNWRDKYKGRFGDIEKALINMKLTTHILCQVSILIYCICCLHYISLTIISTDKCLKRQ